MVGRIIAVYIHCAILGLMLHVLPTEHLSWCRQINASSHFASICSFQLSLRSRMTPKYLTWALSSSSFPENQIGHRASILYFLVNSTISDLLGLTDNSLPVHHFSTPRKMSCIISHIVIITYTIIRTTPSSAKPCANMPCSVSHLSRLSATSDNRTLW